MSDDLELRMTDTIGGDCYVNFHLISVKLGVDHIVEIHVYLIFMSSLWNNILMGPVMVLTRNGSLGRPKKFHKIFV